MRRAWGLPPNHPLLARLSDDDYLREIALEQLETEDLLTDNDPDAAAANEAFDAEVEAAARGDWSALGLDEPGAFVAQSTESFLTEP